MPNGSTSPADLQSATPDATMVIRPSVGTTLSYDDMVDRIKAQGYPEAAARGIADNFTRESGGKVAALGDYEDGVPTSVGIAQWHNERKQALLAYAAAQGKSVFDPDVQFQFLDQEMREQYPQLRKSLMGATSQEQAEDQFKRIYERPKSVMWATLPSGAPVLGNDRFRFDDDAISRADEDDVVYMEPRDYLALSPALDNDWGYSSTGWRDLRASLANGEPVKNLPSLTMLPDGKVTGQDGRTRALLAQLSGLDAIPVALKGAPGVNEIQGMNGMVLPMRNTAPASMLNRLLGIGSAQAAEPGGFDPSTAKLVEDPTTGGGQFDPSTAKLSDDQGDRHDEPHTTAGGLAASVTRGLAPYAAGAGVGGALGAPFGGVGAIPGAAAGAGAVGLTQLAGALYNPLAEKFGWSKMATPQEVTDRLLDLIGERRPTTGIERLAETGAGGVGSALGGSAATAQVAEALSGTAKGVAERLAERPGTQAVAGLTSGLSAQGAAELGAGPVGQTAAGFLGSLLPSGVMAFPRITASDAAKQAIGVGYVLPPAEATEGKIGEASPTNLLAGFSGKVKTRQYASAVNQVTTNRLAAVDLGLPADTVLTPQVYRDVIDDAGKAYADLKAVPSITLNQQYRTAIGDIGREARAAAAEFPDTIDVTAIDKMRSDLTAQDTYSTRAMVELSKRLRFDSKANLQARDDPDKLALGLAQRHAAGAVEQLIEDNLAKTGDTAILRRYQTARQLIAKAYDYESATNVSTNDVDARHLGGLLDKGRPLTGKARIIADSANNFPHAFQPATRIGGVETFSVLDLAYAMAAGSAAFAHGDRSLAAALTAGVPFARPAARAAILSRPWQKAMVSDRPVLAPIPMMMSPTNATYPPGVNLPYIPPPGVP